MALAFIPLSRSHCARRNAARVGPRPTLTMSRRRRHSRKEALRSDTFLSNFLPFMRRVARLGIENSLVQTVGKLTAPGVPDIYQGCELWDLNLVDPDNRRPVDFAQRNAAIADLAARLKVPEQRPALFTTLTDEWQDGRVKLAATALLLALRREEPELFSSGDYQPIVIEGDRSDWAFGYVRASGDRRLAVVMARYPAHREAEPEWSAWARLPEAPLVRPVSRPGCDRRRALSMSGCIRCRLPSCWPASARPRITSPIGGPSSQARARTEAWSARSLRRQRRCRVGLRPTAGPSCRTSRFHPSAS